MRFVVPQFIEHEAKIIGPLTFKQFIYIGSAGAACFVLYFIVPFYVFILACFVLGVVAVALAFIKIGGRTLPAILGNFLHFSLTPKMYIWRKKEQAVTVFKKEEKIPKKKKKEEEEEELPLKISEKSRLKKLSTEIEIQTK